MTDLGLGDELLGLGTGESGVERPGLGRTRLSRYRVLTLTVLLLVAVSVLAWVGVDALAAS